MSNYDDIQQLITGLEREKIGIESCTSMVDKTDLSVSDKNLFKKEINKLKTSNKSELELMVSLSENPLQRGVKKLIKEKTRNITSRYDTRNKLMRALWVGEKMREAERLGIIDSVINRLFWEIDQLDVMRLELRNTFTDDTLKDNIRKQIDILIDCAHKDILELSEYRKKSNSMADTEAEMGKFAKKISKRGEKAFNLRWMAKAGTEHKYVPSMYTQDKMLGWGFDYSAWKEERDAKPFEQYRNVEDMLTTEMGLSELPA